MSRIALACALAASLATGCVIHAYDDDAADDGAGSGSNPGSGSDTGSGSGSGSDAGFAPLAGRWTHEDFALGTTTCAATLDQGAAEDFAIEHVTATSFRVVSFDGTDPFTCALTGKVFDCPDRVTYLRGYPAATVTVRALATGLFASATRATGQEDVTVDCAGSGCTALGTFPCTSKRHVTIAATAR